MAPTQSFQTASVTVYDATLPDGRATHHVRHADELGALVDMNLSYDEEAPTSYRYSVSLVGDGCELMATYDGPSEMDVSVCAKTPASSPASNLGILATLGFKKQTGELHVNTLALVYAVEAGAAPLGEAELAEHAERALAMFRHLHAIAPIAVSKKLKPAIKILGRVPAPHKAAVKKQLAELDVVGRL